MRKMRNKRLFISFVCMLFVQLSVQSQDLLTPENALSIALKNNFEIILAKQNKELAANQNTLGNAGILPEVELVGGFNGSIRDLRQTFVSGNVVNQNNVGTEEFNYALNFGWTIFDGMAMFTRKKLLEGDEAIKEFELKAAVQDLTENLWTVYYNIVANQVLLQSLNELEKLIAQRRTIAQEQYETGAGSKTLVLLATLDHNKIKSQIEELQNQNQNNKVDLLTLMAEENLERDFDVIDSISVRKNLLESSKQKIHFNNPSIQASKLQMENAQLRFKEAQSAFLPTIRLQGAYTGVRAESEAGFLLSNQNRGLNYGITASIPIFRGGMVRNNYKSSRLVSEMSRVSYNLMIWQMQKDEIKELNNLRTHVKLAQTEDVNVGLAKEFMELSLQRFESGLSNILEVKEAQSSYTEILYRKAQYLYLAKISEIRLLKVRGELF
jgi:outer membrane protein